MGKSIDQIREKLDASNDAVAIVMSPVFHARLIHEQFEKWNFESLIGTDVLGLTIIFGEVTEGFKLLNAQEFKILKKNQDYLRIYKQKYEEYKSCINNKDKLINADAVVQDLIRDLSQLSKRIDANLSLNKI